jgi:ribosomal protein S18 acetylase RimI-like enzyme
MPPRIREAEPKDARDIAEIHVRSWRAAYRGQLTDDFLDGLNVEDRLEMHRLALESPPAEYRMWVAEEEGRAVGFAVTGKSEDADADERTAEVFAIYLDPDQVGTGLGRTLFAHAVDDLRDRGYRSATLWVLETNEIARRFYELAGWTHDGTKTSERVDCEMRPTVRYRVEL